MGDEVEEFGTEEPEDRLERAAAIDVAKASGKVCTRTSGPSGRRVSRVWDVGSTTGR